MKRTQLLLLLVAIIAAATVAIHFIAQRRPVGDVIGSGIIETDEIQVSPKIAGRLAQRLVREGDHVRQGQLVATLEHADVDADIERARGAVESAEGALRDMERGSRVEQIDAGRARLEQAEAGRVGAERQLRTAQEAYAKVTELKEQVDAAQARVRGADAGVASALARLDEAQRGPTKEEIETYRAAVRQAEARAETTRVAALNAEEVYRHQSMIEAPSIAASTEAAVDQAQAALAASELSRTERMAKADAATDRSLDQARAQRSVADSRLAGARRSVPDAGEQVALTRAQAKQLLDTARNTLQEALRARDTAQAQLDVALAGTREERVRVAQAALATAQTDAEAARTTLSSATQVYQDRLVARQQRDSAQAQLDSARAMERAARAELQLLLAGQTQEAIQAARGRLVEAQGALKAAETKRAYCEVYAPRDGGITEEVAKEGEMLAAGAPIVILSDLANLRLRAYLGFSTLGKVKVGDTVRVTTGAVPNHVFTGKVIRVSEEAEFTPKDVQTPEQRTKQVYWVKVWLGAAEGLLKPGMPADVRTP